MQPRAYRTPRLAASGRLPVRCIPSMCCILHAKPQLGVARCSHHPARRPAAGHLEVWHAASPLGPWEPHPANPVANGDRSQGFRSGGRLVVHDGRLLRFGQDCGQTYGHKVGVPCGVRAGHGLPWMQPTSELGRQQAVHLEAPSLPLLLSSFLLQVNAQHAPALLHTSWRIPAALRSLTLTGMPTSMPLCSWWPLR